MKFETLRNFWCHFSLSDNKIRSKENVWNWTISLTSHNTSAASMFLVIGCGKRSVASWSHETFDKRCQIYLVVHRLKINAQELRENYLKTYTKQTLFHFCLNVTLTRAKHNEWLILTHWCKGLNQFSSI